MYTHQIRNYGVRALPVALLFFVATLWSCASVQTTPPVSQEQMIEQTYQSYVQSLRAGNYEGFLATVELPDGLVLSSTDFRSSISSLSQYVIDVQTAPRLLFQIEDDYAYVVVTLAKNDPASLWVKGILFHRTNGAWRYVFTNDREMQKAARATQAENDQVLLEMAQEVRRELQVSK